ncbi:RbsD/FucU domain-containing protein [Marinovum sp. 2_MG-2023]|uniref:RbsD/FucU family protein n=1 Tax=unclassified Marinovum TaxID=2647166 RepID=UPI0026E25F00|nr:MULTISPECIES: RbsD/FucU domain-containing protein [unclassified Marinovum]MDO6732255.1 RbsD/FucU domain-containing protein [Marinovum sp. 2_MG-2023]MDO6781525.1 RbsD/FucU domain-containing protein [Marinovum sp. 1_MG-2023]
MLRGLDPILSPDLIYALRAMGHGDTITIADANFPAESSGPEVVRLDGISATDVLRAVMSVMPLDTYVDAPAHVMQVVDAPDTIPEVVKEFQQIINDVADAPAQIKGLERFDFYDNARESFVVVQTGETRLYGNIILKKGVIGS